MKKWHGDPSSCNNDIADGAEAVSNDVGTLNPSLKNESKLNLVSYSKTVPNMGLGVSSEPVPPNAHLSQSAESPKKASPMPHRCSTDIPVSMCHPPVAFITSVSSRIQVSSPCHHLTTQNVSLQLHNSKPSCSSSGSKETPHLMALIPHSKASSSSEHFLTSLDESTDNHNITENKFNLQDSTTFNTSSSNTQGLAISLPSLYPSGGNICHVHCTPENSQLPQNQLSSNNCENIHVESSSENESRPSSANENWCGMGTGVTIHSHHKTSSQCDYDKSLSSDVKKVNHSTSQLSNGSRTNPSTSAVSSSGCGHWCSTCRVRVQVEVECVPGSQRSNGSRRGIRTLSFPKKVRHKVKAPTKDLNGNLKKKKSPWSFRLNCRLRANKSDSEQEPGISTLNVGCVSCVCPGYRRPDSEPVYRSVMENTNSTNNIALHTPMVDLSRFNPEAFPINDLEENARQERLREMVEGVEPPPGFTPNSLALPLTYNSMLDLQVILENSLRIGLGGQRTGGITYPGESLMRHMGSISSESSLLPRTVHTQVDYIHCLVPDLLAITNCGFYWGKMDRYEAERLLENRPEGTFLLRDSAQEEYLFSVSFRRYGRSLHARIEQWNHKFSFDSHDPGVFASRTVCGLIEHYKDPSCCMFFEPLLTNPLARTLPFQLKRLCQATICSRTTYDGVNYLELPIILKTYLKEYHYKQRVRVRRLD